MIKYILEKFIQLIWDNNFHFHKWTSWKSMDSYNVWKSRTCLICEDKEVRGNH